MIELDWLDINDIAIELYDNFPDIDPQWISFPDLHRKVCNLEGFKEIHLNQMNKYLKQFR